jgi:RsiW-degrading membrane proteinase PrsW (M82 family)
MPYNFMFFSTYSILFIYWLLTRSSFRGIRIFILISIAILTFTLAFLLQEIFQDLASSTLASSLLTATIEEGSRAILFWLSFALLPSYFVSKYERLKVAMLCGILFAMFEGAGYLLSLAPASFVIRQFITTPLHIFLSTIQIEYAKRGVFFAWLLHLLYNLAYQVGSPTIQLAQISAIASILATFMWLERAKPKGFTAF